MKYVPDLSYGLYSSQLKMLLLNSVFVLVKIIQDNHKKSCQRKQRSNSE